MPRRRFDPAAAKGDLFTPERAAPAKRDRKKLATLAEADRLTVSQVTDLIKSTLEQRIPSPLRVIGEVSNLSARNHWYFSLKDEQAVLSCVAWASAAKKFGFTPSDGDEVVATGHISHYPPQGRTQLYVSKLEPVGAGALELAFRRLCEELRGLGYFDAAHKVPLPAFPRCIAVITSAGGAAVHDVIATAAQRCPAVGLLIVDVHVQGEGAAAEIARAIRWVDRHHARLGVDAILVTRGGGSLEDLWAFNERIVADAAFACGLPLVAAIGHESDTTVIELVADVRAATPTQAAMLLIPSADDLHRQVDHLRQRLNLLTGRLVERCRERLMAIDRIEAFRAPMVMVDAARERIERLGRDIGRVLRGRLAHDRSRLEHLSGRWQALHPQAMVSARHEKLAVLRDRLGRASGHRLERIRGLINAFDRQLIALDPRKVLGRGYSYTTDQTGGLIRSVGEVRTGQAIVTHVSDGTIDSVVGGRTARPKRPRRSASGKADQMDLFRPAE